MKNEIRELNPLELDVVAGGQGIGTTKPPVYNPIISPIGNPGYPIGQLPPG